MVVPVNTSIVLTAHVDDSTTGGSNIASAEYGLDGGITWAAMDGVSGEEVAEDVNIPLPAFTAATVVSVCVRGTDTAGKIGPSECVLLAVYDPNGGFVTGGGWINSPPGAYAPDGTLTGKASFGFVSKYPKGATVPQGNTEFQFQAADLNFHSVVYEWLVVSGAKAQYRGCGTINGVGNCSATSGPDQGYEFMLTAIDGNLLGGNPPDKFRLRIWDRSQSTDGSSGLIYDNQVPGGSCTDTSANATPCTMIGGGSIQIKK
jgi:hypothetical protein